MRGWPHLPIRKAIRCPKRWRRSRCPLPRCVMPLSSRHEITVEWGDCDPAGIVYYPSYFRWCDEATYRLFLKAGMRRDDISSGQWKEGTPLVAAECSFPPCVADRREAGDRKPRLRFGRSSSPSSALAARHSGGSRPGWKPRLGAQRRRALAAGGDDSRGCEEIGRWPGKPGAPLTMAARNSAGRGKRPESDAPAVSSA